ncbi:MAG TPA: glycosyltransferase [Anaerolineae bacterium]|nr:glycosyltransferase [Anaerolineae bacterium]
MRVSLIVTVKNEAGSIGALLDSIAAQTRPPDEVVVCDGGSTDATLEVLRGETRFPVRVIERPGANISQGRNAAIEAASGDIIASTDAGVRLDPDWLRVLVAPFGREPQTRVVSGFFAPAPQTAFEVAMGAAVLPERRDIRPETFLPSSRSVAFRKEVWKEVGGYPEWLDYCEDLVFDFALQEKYHPFAFAPDAIVHFRPRRSLRAFFQQYYRYARGDGKASLWLRRHVIRYATYLIGVPGIAALSAVISPWLLLLYLAGAAAYTRTPYRRLRPRLRTMTPGDKLKAVALVPVIRVVGDVAKMIGYPVGVVWRLRRRPSSRDSN